MKNQIYNIIVEDAQKKVRNLAKKNNWLWFFNLHQIWVIILIML